VRFRTPIAAALVAVGAATVGATSETIAATSPCGASAGATRQTKDFTFTVSIGKEQAMYTRAEVRAKHITHGEVMLAGRMAPGMNMGPGMRMAEQTRHLEVHICSRTTGQPVQAPQPTITVTDLSNPGKKTLVPIAVMYDTAVGRSDIHFGNNVLVIPGHRVRIDVTEAGERLSFVATVPQ
jgi:hypothetical protein